MTRILCVFPIGSKSNDKKLVQLEILEIVDVVINKIIEIKFRISLSVFLVSVNIVVKPFKGN